MVEDLLLADSVFSFIYLKFVLGTSIVYFISVHSAVKAVGERIILSRAIIISVIMAFCFTACRRFLPTPYNMLLFYVLMVGVVAFVFKLPLRKSIVGVVFALLLTMLSSVAITMNLFIYTNIDAGARDSLGLFLFITLTEVAFNLFYVLLAMRYENLNLSFLFSEEKNAKA